MQLGLNDITAASRCIDEKGDAQQLLAKCKETMKAVIKSMGRKEKTERSPLLYDLTSLQRDANRILGFTAQQTLDYTKRSMFDSNLQRQPITYSEKAFAYKMKNEAMKRKTGKRRKTADGKLDHFRGESKRTVEIISDQCGDSPRQITRKSKDG